MVYLIQAFGDLPTKAPFIFGGSRAFATLDETLKWLSEVLDLNGDDDICLDKVWFDPEDDRIVVYEVNPLAAAKGESVKAVWHASGWHWQYDAADLPGGPLDQGCLPGDDKSVYEISNSE